MRGALISVELLPAPMVIVLLCLLAIASMIALIVFLPNVTVKGFHFSTFYLPPLLLALVFLIFPLFDKTALWDAFFTNSPLNPLKILVLFLSISVLSISLDNSGFFAYLASVAIKKYHASQHALFFALFILISLTTIFTSNDIVILTFTPFIIYLSKKGKINPIPYLIMEFVAGNSFSMLLEIGNPTNIFLSLAYNISFLDYLLSMALPSLLIGMSSLLILLFLFRKDLKKPILDFDVAPHPIEDPLLMWVSLVHLAVTIILLALANFLGFEMWLITAIFALTMTLFLAVYSLIKKKNHIGHTFIRLPYSLIPFILSMFVLIMGMDATGLFAQIGAVLNGIANPLLQGWAYLFASTLSCNLVNNIPMTLMFSRILDGNLVSVYATIIGSNLGALLTPIGALAGIMWMGILKEKHIDFSFKKFMLYGLPITGFLLLVAMGGIALLTLIH